MKRCRFLSILLLFTLIFSMTPANVYAAKKNKIGISDKKITLEVGTSYDLSITNTKSNMVSWSSANNDIAIVSEEGSVLGISAGKVKVTGKYKGKNYSCTVIVKSSDELSCYVVPKEDMPRTTSYLFEDITDTILIDENDDYYIFVVTNESINTALTMICDIIGKQPVEYSIEYDDTFTNFNVSYSSNVSDITHNKNINIVKDLRDYIWLYKILCYQSVDNVVFYFSHDVISNEEPKDEIMNTLNAVPTTEYLDTITLRETYN